MHPAPRLHAHFAVGRFVPPTVRSAHLGRASCHIQLLDDLPIGSAACGARLAARYLARYVGQRSLRRRAAGCTATRSRRLPARRLVLGVRHEVLIARRLTWFRHRSRSGSPRLWRLAWAARLLGVVSLTRAHQPRSLIANAHTHQGTVKYHPHARTCALLANVASAAYRAIHHSLSNRAYHVPTPILASPRINESERCFLRVQHRTHLVRHVSLQQESSYACIQQASQLQRPKHTAHRSTHHTAYARGQAL